MIVPPSIRNNAVIMMASNFVVVQSVLLTTCGWENTKYVLANSSAFAKSHNTRGKRINSMRVIFPPFFF